jgi:hypothetical protein
VSGAPKLISIIEWQLNGNHSRRVTGNLWPIVADGGPISGIDGAFN